MKASTKKARIIALYLPQFHPIPENDAWWGKGFTEWTNVAQARPLFKGHYQPRIPSDLGFYDLRLPEVREQQAMLAKEAGIEAFCYYHYWFGGKQLLERPLNEVVQSSKPDFPFCICWANHTWSSATWTASGKKSSILIEQTYPGKEDHIAHFKALLPAFKDQRYYTIEGRLVFTIYDPFAFPQVGDFMQLWNELAKAEGLPGFYFIAMVPSTLTFDPQTHQKQIPNLKSSAALYNYALQLGFDAVNSFGKRRGELLEKGMTRSMINRILGMLHLNIHAETYNYPSTVANYFAPEDSWENVYPTILPQWDRTPRNGSREGIYINSTPEAFEQHIRHALSIISHKQPEHQILFLKSWNEWGEGNYVEPDVRYGHQWLKAIKNSIL